MKTRYYISIVMLMLLNIFAASAQTNTLTIPDVTVAAGNTISLPVNLDNTADIVAVQFTLNVPEGITIQPSSAAMTERADGHSITMQPVGENKYMTMIFSSANKAIKGRTGKLMSVNLTASSALEEGSEHQLVLSDVVIGAVNGDNLATGFSAGKVAIAKSPDLEVSSVSTTASALKPGDKLSVSWQVNNIGGLPTAAGWSEQIYLDGENGTSKLLATTYYDSALNEGGVVSRSAEIDLPQILGVDGNATVRVKLTPDSKAGEPSWLRDNNTASSTTTISVGKMLSISPEKANVEEASKPNVRFYLQRSGNTTADETFTLAATADSRITLPASITISKGQSGVYFYAQVNANGVLDDNDVVALAVSGNGYDEAGATLNIEDDTCPSLTLTSSAQDVEEGKTITFTITAQRAPKEDLEIKLSNDFSSRFNTPSIVMPAGQTSVDVTVEAKQDDVPDVEQVVTFTAQAAGYNPASMNIVLVDDDVPTLQLTLTPDAVSEAAGPLAVVATLRRTDNINKVVTVKFSDDSDGGIYYGRQSVEMAAGVEEVTVNLGPIDNAIVDGERTYNISAAVWIASCSCNATGTQGGGVSAPLTVYDNDGPTLTLSSSSTVLKEGGEITLTVSRNTDTTETLTVNLTSDHDSALEYPSTVVIPVGEESVAFTVKCTENDTNGDGFTAVITASSGEFAKSNIWFTVSDQTLADAQISAFEVSASEVLPNETLTATVTIINTGSYELPPYTKVDFYLDNSNKAVANTTLQNALAVGGSVTISQGVTMPNSIGTYNVYVKVNEDQVVKELSFGNNMSQLLPVKTIAPFKATVQTDKAIYQKGETIVVTGQLQGNDVANKEVEIYFINDYDRRTISATALADGSFRAEYTPITGQMGHFTVGACFASENLNEEMASFDIYGLKTSAWSKCELAVTEEHKGTITIGNPGNLAQTNIKVSALAESENCEFTFTSIDKLEAGASATIAYTVKGNDVSTTQGEWQEMPIKITSDEGAEANHKFYYYVQPLHGQLHASQSAINTTMSLGSSRDYPVTIRNIGKGETGQISLSLPACVTSATPQRMPSLASGDSATVILRFNPTSEMQLNVTTTGVVGINCDNGDGTQIKFAVTPVSEVKGTLKLDIVDEFTFYTEEAPHISGANVTIKKPNTNEVVASGVTDDSGIFQAELQEGWYTVNVEVDKHDSYTNQIIVDPGVVNEHELFMPYQAVTYSWDVVETEIEDEYETETVVKFETIVPKPVVVITLPENRPQPNEIVPVYVTNHGLINALNLELNLSASSGYSFEFLSDPTAAILTPQQTIIFYARLISDSSLSPDDCFYMRADAQYEYPCPKYEHKEHSYALRSWGNCGGPGGSGGSGGSGGWGWGSGGFGGGGLGGPSSWGGSKYYGTSDTVKSSTTKDCNNNNDEETESICSTITLSFKQQAVMTRQAFRGTLTLNNGYKTDELRDFKLNLEVRNDKGELMGRNMFEIAPESLTGFVGENNFNAGWSLAPASSGVATALFIPTKYAAPTEPKDYSFGGSFSYTDPSTGTTVTRDLNPITLTVKPSPNLDLTYFMQRDVIGDDPLTEAIEPCEEAEFSLLINNIGYGDATNVKMITNQPEIVENEKGLLIDFELMSSQLNGGDKTLALGTSVATDFGTIPAKSTSYAQWWIKSSLLGHFTEYDVQATHVTSYDNPDLTLLNDVTIHELIRSLEIGEGENKMVGFMTNDIADADDTPDMLYLSNGEIETVAVAASSGIVKTSDADYTLTVNPSKDGWNYGSLTDPTYGVVKLKKIVRQSDGKEISLRNFWQTDRTLRDSKDPLYENRIHFADNFATEAAETYILTFEPMPELVLDVASIEGIPAEGTIAHTHVESVNVMFNKHIDPATFTTDDVTLAVQGKKQDTSVIGISTEDNKTFTLDLTELNKQAGNGYYVLTIQTAEVTDAEGFNGKAGKSVGWNMYKDGLVLINTSVNPVNAGTISGNRNALYGENVTLTAEANNGYEFSNWTVNGDENGKEPVWSAVATGDMDVTANFIKKSYAVTIESENEGGAILGAYTGIYPFGQELTLSVATNDGYLFKGWIVNDELISNDATLTVTVDSVMSISAKFVNNKKYNQVVELSKGWNWVSGYLNEALPVEPLLEAVNRVVGQFEETIKDPELGFIGGIESLELGKSYKIEATSDFSATFTNHLYNLGESPIVMKRGWNWIAYPYYESRNINAVVTNAEEGDYIASQYGFTSYADGYWEGSINQFHAGQGYLYKSASDKTLALDFDTVTPKAMVLSKEGAGMSTGNGVDVHKYPNTMNITARLYQESYELADGEYDIYALSGSELRGIGQFVNGNYYITVYGDIPTEISFIIENSNTAESYMANEKLMFTNDIVGSRKAPYTITIGDATGIYSLMTDRREIAIYSIEGQLINRNAKMEDIKKLHRGVYIVNGKKYLVK